MTIPGLMEIAFGSFEMKSYNELKEEADYQAWIEDKTGDVLCPGGESRNHYKKRVAESYAEMLDMIRQSGSRSALAVCHAGTIAAIMAFHWPDIGNYYNWLPQPGRGYTLVYDAEKPVCYKRI